MKYNTSMCISNFITCSDAYVNAIGLRTIIADVSQHHQQKEHEAPLCGSLTFLHLPQDNIAYIDHKLQVPQLGPFTWLVNWMNRDSKKSGLKTQQM